MRIRTGLTLLELLVVVAVVAVLGTLGIVNLPRDRIQVREAARVITADINRARSEAIRLNTRVELSFNTGTDCYTLSETEDQDDNVLATAREVQERCISAEFPLADVSAAVFANAAKVSFDSRGLPSGSMGGTITVRSRRNTAYTQQIIMASQGRVRIQ